MNLDDVESTLKKGIERPYWTTFVLLVALATALILTYVFTRVENIAADKQKPIAEITTPNTNLAVGEATFSGGRSYDPDGQIVEWQWSVEGEKVGSEENLRYRFAQAGDFIVKLVVIDDDDESAQSVEVVAVVASAEIEEPPPPMNPRSEPRCPERTILVNARPISTGPAEARVVQGDDEIDTDDWTSVDLSYRVETVADGTGLALHLTWSAQERNKNRSPADTRITSNSVVGLFEVEPQCAGSRVLAVEGYADRASKEYFYNGQRHGFHAYPDTGALTGITVQFDGKGRQDHQRQALRATFPQFAVKLSASTLKDAIVAGKPFEVIFDEVSEGEDPGCKAGEVSRSYMGTLKASRTYNVVFGKDTGRFTTTGPNQGRSRCETITNDEYSGDPSTYKLSLWGWPFRYNEEGEVFNEKDDRRVGRIVLK